MLISIITIAVVVVFISTEFINSKNAVDDKSNNSTNIGTSEVLYDGVLDYNLIIPDPLRKGEVNIFENPKLGETYQIDYEDPQYDNLEALSVPYSIMVTVANAGDKDASHWSQQYLFSGSEEITNISEISSLTIDGQECVQQFELTKKNAPTEKAAMQMTYCINDNKLFNVEGLANNIETLEQNSELYDSFIEGFKFVK
jgi:hypothetical protein